MGEESSDAPWARADRFTVSAAAEEDHDDWSVLSMLLDRESHHGLWSVDELGRTLTEPVQAVDAVGRLLRDGLIHKSGDFVFPTRAATRFNEISQ